MEIKNSYNLDFLNNYFTSDEFNFINNANLENEKLTAVKQVEKAISTIYGKFSKKNIIELCPLLSKTSIERALKELITARKIKKYGDKKATYYTK